MKIGIITLPLHTNYGGILQTYALQTVLERMGHEVNLIQIGEKHGGFFSRLHSFLQRVSKTFTRHHQSSIVVEYYKKRKYHHLYSFIEKYIREDCISGFTDETAKKYDVIVVGSDQIWRRKYILNLNMFNAAFLLFANDTNVRRIAYAPSFGVDVWEYSFEETQIIRDAIGNFDAVSVREDSGIELCRRNLGIDAELVLDPVMLLDKSDYIKLIRDFGVEPFFGKEMVYILDENKEKMEHINNLLKNSKRDTFVNLCIEANSSNWDYRRKHVLLVEWLRGFNDAEFIITDSFHACVFAILFGKPFIVVGNEERGTARFLSLLRTFGLEKHLIRRISEYDPNYSYAIPTNVQDKIENQRKRSMDFLAGALEKAEKAIYQ